MKTATHILSRILVLVVCLLLCLQPTCVQAQCPPGAPCGEMQLIQPSGTVLATLPYTRLSTAYNQKSRIKTLTLKIRLDLEKHGVYPLGKLDWGASLQLRCVFKQGGSILRVKDLALTAGPSRPELLAEVDVADLENKLTSVEVKLVQYNVTGPQSNFARQHVRCGIELVPEAAFDVVDLQGAAFSVLEPKVTGIACGQNSNEVCQLRFSWELPTNRKVEAFEVELLKMEPKIHGASLEMDWSKANRLVLETGSTLLQTSLGQPGQTRFEFTYLVAEGTGYYAWRVRPIGNYYDGGMSKAKNYGTWNSMQTSFSGHGYQWSSDGLDISSFTPPQNLSLGAGSTVNGSVFYYRQFDESKNWIYGRIFSEGSRIAETMTYANGLSQVEQVQTKSYSQNQVMATQSVMDFSGRPALQTMVAPIGSDQIRYSSNFLRKANYQAYTAADFDSDNATIYPSSSNIDPSLGPGKYYSDQNSGSLNPHGDYVPDANGFPFTRNLYYPDATGRVYKQGGPGEVMRLQDANGHNVTTYYGAVTQGELDIIFGNEAPLAATVYKVLTIDPNKVGSVTYVAKNGTVLATCLSHLGTLLNLKDVGNEGEPGLRMLEYKLDGGDFAQGDASAKQQTTIIIQGNTNAAFYYELTPQTFGIACKQDVCYTCDYRVEFEIMLTQDPSFHARFNFDVDPKRLADCQTAQTALVLGTTLPFDSVKFDSGNAFVPIPQPGILNFPVEGTYLVTKTVHTNNLTGNGRQYWLDVYEDSLQSMHGRWTADSNCCRPIVVDTTSWDCEAREPWCDSTSAQMADSIMYWLRLEQRAGYKDRLADGGSGLKGFPYFQNANLFHDTLNAWINQRHLDCSEVWACFQTMGGMLEQNVEAVDSGGNPMNLDPIHQDTSAIPSGPEYDPSFDLIQSVRECLGLDDVCGQYKRVALWWGSQPPTVGQTLLVEIPNPNSGGSASAIGSYNLSCAMTYYTFSPQSLVSGQVLDHPNWGLSNEDAAAGICDCLHNRPDFNSTVAATVDTLQAAIADQCLSGCEDHRQAFAQAIDNWVVEYNRVHGHISMTDSHWIPIDTIMRLDRSCIIQVMVDQCKHQCRMERTNSINSDSLAQSPSYADSIRSSAFQAILKQERLEYEQAMNWVAEYAHPKDPQYGGGYSDFGENAVVFEEVLTFLRSSLDDMLQHPTSDASISFNPELYHRQVSSNSLRLAHRHKPFTLKVSEGNSPEYRKFTVTANILYDSASHRIEEMNIIFFCGFDLATPTHRPDYPNVPIAHWAYQPNHGNCPRLDAFNYAVGLNSAEIVKLTLDRHGIVHAVLVEPACPGNVLADGICTKSGAAEFSLTVGPGVDTTKTLSLSLQSRLDYFDLVPTPVSRKSNPIATATAIATAINANQAHHPFIASNLDIQGVPTSTVTIQVPPDFEGQIDSLRLVKRGNLLIQTLSTPRWCSNALFQTLVDRHCEQVNDSSRRVCPYGFFPVQVEYCPHFSNSNAGIDSAITYGIAFVNHTITQIAKNERSPTSAVCWFRYDWEQTKIKIGDRDAWWFCTLNREQRCQLSYSDDNGHNWIPCIEEINHQGRIFKVDTIPGNLISFRIMLLGCAADQSFKFMDILLTRENDSLGLWPAFSNPSLIPQNFSAIPDLFNLSLQQSGSLLFSSSNDNASFFSAKGLSLDLQNYPLHVAAGGRLRDVIRNSFSTARCGPQCEVCMRWSPPDLPAELATPAPAEPYTCEKALQEYVNNTVQTILDSCLAARLEQMRATYYASCLGRITDKCSIQIGAAYHHYTLYYRDRANNLIATIPPEGVDFLSSGTDTMQIQAHRRNPANPPLYPSHTLETNYQYNSVGQLVQQTSPDGGTSKFWYNAAGQLVLSQDAQQALDGKYAYSRYDHLGRIVESGILFNFTPTVGTNPMIITQLWDQLSFPNNLSPGSVQKKEVVHTEYTVSDPTVSYNGQPQMHLRNRISHIWKDENNDGYGKNNTWYSYDEHGNVRWLKQELPVIGIKSMLYDYDLVSGKVNKVYYQEGTKEQFIHRYEYDADNRIVNVFTSKDDQIWERDAGYQYYLHGPLARKELGEDKVQGMDYVYTIEGYLKSINQVELDSLKDPGRDGTQQFGYIKDEFAMELGYYKGDYERSGSQIGQSNGAVYPYGGSGGMIDTQDDLYNGNISYWMSNIRSGQKSAPGINPVGLQMRQCEYDVLNRLREANWRRYENGAWQANTNGTYNESFTYDGNGNILTLMRNGYDGPNATVAMDDLTYRYNNGNNQLVSNRLYHVNDGVANSPYADDLEDQGVFSGVVIPGPNGQPTGNGQLPGAPNGPGPTPNNYRYDAEGNLVADLSEGILEIKWNAANKVREVVKANSQHIYFTYDALGNRITKTLAEMPPGGPNRILKTTFYVRDASGNVMAIYSQAYDAQTDSTKLLLEELPIYGADRVGMYRPNLVMAAEAGYIPSLQSAITEDPSVQKTWLIPGSPNVVQVNFPVDGNPTFSSLPNSQGLLNKAHTAVQTDAKGAFLFGVVVTNEGSPRLRLIGKDQNPMLNTGNPVISCGKGLNMEPIIVPKPGVANHYFVVFHTGSGFSSIQALEVNMDGNNGNGATDGVPINIANQAPFGHKLLAFTYEDGGSRLLVNGKSADGKTMLLYKIDVTDAGFGGPTIAAIMPMPYENLVQPQSEICVSPNGKQIAVGLWMSGSPFGAIGSEFFDVATWDLEPSSFQLHDARRFKVGNGKVMRVEYSPSGDYLFYVKIVTGNAEFGNTALFRLDLKTAGNVWVQNGTNYQNVQRIRGGAMLFNAAMGDNFQKIANPDMLYGSFTLSTFAQGIAIKRGEFPQATYPVSGPMDDLNYQIKSTNRNWIASTSGAAGIYGMNTLTFPETGPPQVANPITANAGASRNLSIGETKEGTLEFRQIATSGWTNYNVVFGSDNALLPNGGNLQGDPDLPSIAVDLPGEQHGYYIFTCAGNRLKWHKVVEEGGNLAVVSTNQDLMLEVGEAMGYDTYPKQVAMAAYQDLAVGGGSLLFVAAQWHDAIALCSFRLYPDRIAPGKVVKWYGSPDVSDQGRLLGEMQISPNGQELSIAMSARETSGLPIRHRFERFTIDPRLQAGLVYDRTNEVQGEGPNTQPSTAGWPLYQILSHDYSPDGNYIYFFQKTMVSNTIRNVFRVIPGSPYPPLSPALRLSRLNRQTGAVETIETYQGAEQKGVVRRGADGRLYLNYQKSNPGNQYVPFLYSYGVLNNGSATAVAASRSQVMLQGGQNRYGLPLQPWRRYATVARAESYASRVVGERVYELNDHLGNVRVTVGDMRGHLDLGNGGVGFGEMGVLSFGDYYAFGSTISGRNFDTNETRFGFNGMEKDYEVENGNYASQFWEYGSRLGIRWNTDPVLEASMSPYACFANNPMMFDDPDGDSPNPPQTGGHRSAIRQPNWLETQRSINRSNARYRPNNVPMDYLPNEKYNRTPYAVTSTYVDPASGSKQTIPRYPVMFRMNSNSNSPEVARAQYNAFEAMQILGNAIKNIKEYKEKTTTNQVSGPDYNYNTETYYPAQYLTVTTTFVNIPDAVQKLENLYQNKVATQAKGRLTKEQFNGLSIQEQTSRLEAAKFANGSSPLQIFKDMALEKLKANADPNLGGTNSGNLKSAPTYQGK